MANNYFHYSIFNEPIQNLANILEKHKTQFESRKWIKNTNIFYDRAYHLMLKAVGCNINITQNLERLTMITEYLSYEIKVL